ncbi:carbohydrate ABC transporter permease [Hyphomicrobium facile]|uniref:Carbohydrate ABC transporter membrane protein 1, CUT1 family n=1 Tax=Hyphomicrobium facile TaxID=51670 RepID=A0A1I7N4D4_9HYPH|nr:sugar ABC transporter permease [Hyphomicrobium facile]SFV29525.1 carbohydrate ABC transporter membrane protein 1, CUT1 family [Hyphomicrobium facile]
MKGPNARAARQGLWFFLPAGVFLTVILVYPMLYSLYASLTNMRLTSPITRFVGLDTYWSVLTNSAFGSSLAVTVIFLVAAISLEFLIGFALALSFKSMRNTHPIMRALLMLPLMATPVSVGLIWKLMLNSDFGIIPYAGQQLGFGTLLWLADPILAMVSIIIMDVWQWTPFMFLILLAGLEGLPEEVFEAAEVDGSRSFDLLIHITLPLMSRIIAVALAFRVMFAIATFDTVFVLTKGGPARATDLITLLIQREGLVNLNVALASAMSFLVLLMVTAFSAFTFKRVLSNG